MINMHLLWRLSSFTMGSAPFTKPVNEAESANFIYNNYLTISGNLIVKF